MSSFNARLTIKGQKQGQIGESEKGKPDGFDILDLSANVTSPRDAASGLPTGKRQHKPISMSIPVSAHTVSLFGAIVNNERVDGEIIFYKDDLYQSKYMTIKFDSGSLASWETKFSSVHEHMFVLNITLTFSKITITSFDPGVEASDDWETSVY